MLRFYYGDDIQVETATGSCVTPVDPDASTPDPDSGVKHDSKVTKKDGDGQQLDALPRGDGDPLPTGDVRPFLPPGETPRSSLAGGCSIGAGGDARTCGGPLALAILILVARRRRDAPRG